MIEVMAWLGENETSLRGWLTTGLTPVAAYFAYRAFRRGQENDEDRDTERRRAQAREVSAWVVERFDEYDLPVIFQKMSMGLGAKGRHWYWSVVVANQSSTPVYDLFARVFHVSDTERVLGVLQLAQALPKRETILDIEQDGDSELSQIVLHQLSGDDEDEEGKSKSGTHASDFLVELTFRDANNVWWRRSARGLLDESQQP